MINANDVVDQTENIRREKHSSKIREDVKMGLIDVKTATAQYNFTEEEIAKK